MISVDGDKLFGAPFAQGRSDELHLFRFNSELAFAIQELTRLVVLKKF